MIDWQNIETVLLDMDGTLLDLYFDNYFWLEHLPKRYAELHHISEAEAKAILQPIFEQTQGTLNWYCLDYWSDTLKVDIPKLKQEVKHLISIRPKVVDFLKWLEKNGKKKLLVTNAHRDSLDIKLMETEIHHHLDELISSHDYRAPKEDQSFWQQLQQDHPFDPNKTLLIDDSQAVLKSAQRYGIRYLLSISQPDSQLPHRDQQDFHPILCFSDLMVE